jgi:hypothetical protein
MNTHHLVERLNISENHDFSFDFSMFCVTVNVGRTQAACSSHKEMASSTFSAKNKTEAKTEKSRAPKLTFLTLAAQRLQALQGRMADTARWVKMQGRAFWIDLIQPAFFPPLSFLFCMICSISTYPLTSRVGRRAVDAADLTRLLMQKVAPC